MDRKRHMELSSYPNIKILPPSSIQVMGRGKVLIKQASDTTTNKPGSSYNMHDIFNVELTQSQQASPLKSFGSYQPSGNLYTTPPKRFKSAQSPNKKRKFTDNKISPKKKALFEGFKQDATNIGQESEELKLLRKIYKVSSKNQEQLILIKNLMISEKKNEESYWTDIVESFPFNLPIETEQDVQNCESFIEEDENKEKLVSI